MPINQSLKSLQVILHTAHRHQSLHHARLNLQANGPVATVARCTPTTYTVPFHLPISLPVLPGWLRPPLGRVRWT